MKTFLISIVLALCLSACSSNLIPGFALHTDGSAVAQVTAGTEYVVLQGDAGGALKVMTRLAADGPYVEAGSLPIAAGATRAWRVTWGGLGADGWVQLDGVDCAEIAPVYPWIDCPNESASGQKVGSEGPRRYPAYIRRQ